MILHGRPAFLMFTETVFTETVGFFIRKWYG
jgi:hypothetical protein